MRRVIYFSLFIMMCVLLFGCANTIRGISEDTKNNWTTIKKWDANFRKNWW